MHEPPLHERSVTCRAPLGSLHPLDPLDDDDDDDEHVLEGVGTAAPLLPLLAPPLVLFDAPLSLAPAPPIGPSSMSWHEATHESATTESATPAPREMISCMSVSMSRGLPSSSGYQAI
jgi:hypothetical protein